MQAHLFIYLFLFYYAWLPLLVSENEWYVFKFHWSPSKINDYELTGLSRSIYLLIAQSVCHVAQWARSCATWRARTSMYNMARVFSACEMREHAGYCDDSPCKLTSVCNFSANVAQLLVEKCIYFGTTLA